MFKKLFMAIKSLFVKKETQIPQVKEPFGWHQEWTNFIKSFYLNNDLMFERIANAQDITEIRPDFKKLTKDQKLDVLAAFIKAMCLFESGYDPKSASVDVGSEDNKDTWSVGLLQLSVCDQVSYRLPLGYDYNKLLMPIYNLDLEIGRAHV